jgi:hypothetical protein
MEAPPKSNDERDILDLGPLCHSPNQRWLISQGHAAARPVLVAAAWQPSAVASSQMAPVTARRRPRKELDSLRGARWVRG